MFLYYMNANLDRRFGLYP